MQEGSEEREGASQELAATFSGSHSCHDRDLCFGGITPNRVGIKIYACVYIHIYIYIYIYIYIQGKFHILLGGVCERC